MSFLYASKRISRSWHLFLALLLGIVLASAFFAGIDIKANVTAEQALDQQLTSVFKDMEITSFPFNLTQLDTIKGELSTTENVQSFEVMSRMQGSATVYSEANQSKELYPAVVGLAENSRVYAGWPNKTAGGLGEKE